MAEKYELLYVYQRAGHSKEIKIETLVASSDTEAILVARERLQFLSTSYLGCRYVGLRAVREIALH